ncbi:MAG: response regulator [Anaerolineae bacterium]|nr:response regulator [Anaerolineae bacterium]
MSYTILYVEDEPAIIELVHDILEHKDIQLVSACSAAEGIQKARETKPHLMMLDVLMPDRSGWSIYNEVRSDPAFKDVPIIMLTGQLHRYRIMKEFSHSAIDAYITKPFDVNTVRQEIEKMLGVPIWSDGKKQSAQPKNSRSPKSRKK